MPLSIPCYLCVAVARAGCKALTSGHPEGGGGENPKQSESPSFVVQAVEAVGADHGILAVQVVEDVARKRMRCGSCCRAACN
jgi:hypothetical protein